MANSRWKYVPNTKIRRKRLQLRQFEQGLKTVTKIGQSFVPLSVIYPVLTPGLGVFPCCAAGKSRNYGVRRVTK